MVPAGLVGLYSAVAPSFALVVIILIGIVPLAGAIVTASNIYRITTAPPRVMVRPQTLIAMHALLTVLVVESTTVSDPFIRYLAALYLIVSGMNRALMWLRTIPT